MSDVLEDLAATLGGALRARGWQVTAAESCTGGLIAATLTAVPGSSEWFGAAFVTYSNFHKTQILGVAPGLLEVHGAVSEPVVLAMARGALERSGAHLAVAASGIAGPSGGTPEKPVGTVWLAWAWDGGARAQRHQFAGGRAAVRRQAVEAALAGLLAQVTG
ncbi:MAG: hypothetical protein KatS3mg124_0129 [Porticoccaceae bacterium]|nr:MAG: hypothetical protein KatS3mg124_0129 [Porticoccaceae bacterium]